MNPVHRRPIWPARIASAIASLPTPCLDSLPRRHPLVFRTFAAPPPYLASRPPSSHPGADPSGTRHTLGSGPAQVVGSFPSTSRFSHSPVLADSPVRRLLYGQPSLVVPHRRLVLLEATAPHHA
ncbi:hypothetical protein SETIT_9G150200v2 [Setaria italica]|uniref:Uncharacterized protein n=2 Tax=Setaria TaxID=4554 RepID=A0A368SGW3_SETIT|nr:hypothetical protein SETIT_9G150200v2 [Setaria italica]TKV92196.1 hypothetical protein SEVIR_9G148700v2 [Setaria viridis]